MQPSRTSNAQMVAEPGIAHLAILKFFNKTGKRYTLRCAGPQATSISFLDCTAEPESPKHILMFLVVFNSCIQKQQIQTWHALCCARSQASYICIWSCPARLLSALSTNGFRQVHQSA
eukprot:gnl/TRDRNA2_/TRDRNA2_67445_c0_seq1.p1 gnl/TRDRNA2_/TRDRNA2_67445_c0~~gnl/TRDRNA2_/TRDRNA2_67445_c0_seq1.p1  ORF type:complete len:118 (-),score=4.43 gnl/TRDRNA2_/TRDRNA2_67445_c0_seq1:32-385(-)